MCEPLVLYYFINELCLSYKSAVLSSSRSCWCCEKVAGVPKILTEILQSRYASMVYSTCWLPRHRRTVHHRLLGWERADAPPAPSARTMLSILSLSLLAFPYRAPPPSGGRVPSRPRMDGLDQGSGLDARKAQFAEMSEGVPEMPAETPSSQAPGMSPCTIKVRLPAPTAASRIACRVCFPRAAPASPPAVGLEGGTRVGAARGLGGARPTCDYAYPLVPLAR